MVVKRKMCCFLIFALITVTFLSMRIERVKATSSPELDTIIAPYPHSPSNTTNFKSKWTDDTYNLDYDILSTNNTGEWVNETAIALSGQTAWLNDTITLNDTIGNLVQAKYYVNNTNGDWTVSDTFPIRVQNTSYTTSMFLHNEGGHIRNDNDEVVLLKGVNYGAYNGDTDGDWDYKAGGTIDENFDNMSDYWGANTWRTFLCASYWQGNVDGYIQNLENATKEAMERGIYVIFAPWRTNISYGSVGNPLDQGWTEGDLADFLLNVTKTMWQYPNWILEVWNEPRNYPLNYTFSAEWQSAGQAVIDAIRNAGYDNPIIYQYNICGTADAGEPPANYALVNWHTTFAVNDTINNLWIGTHTYGEFEGYNWDGTDYATLKNDMDEAQYDDVASQLGKPLVMTEGTGNNDELNFIENMLTIFDEWSISYVGWTWSLNYPTPSYKLRNGTKEEPSFEPSLQGEIWREHFLGQNYKTTGLLYSTNLLNAKEILSIEAFNYTATIPTNTTLEIMFSQDNSSWVNSTGDSDWQSLSDGNHTIDLTGLGWTTPYFYYCCAFNSTDGSETPKLEYIAVQYTSSSWTLQTELNFNLIASLSHTMSWNLLGIATFNVISALTHTMQWLLDVMHISGAQQFFVDLSYTISQSWTLLTQATFNLIQSWTDTFSWTLISQTIIHVIPSWTITQSWTILTQATMNVISQWQTSLTWLVEAVIGLQYYVDLAWTTPMTWLVEATYISGTIEYATKGFVVAMAVAFMSVALGAGLLFTTKERRRKKKNGR